MTKPMTARPRAGRDVPPRTPGRGWLALGAIAASFLVVGLDSYIVVTALPTFSARLGASESQLQWITAAYTLAGAGLRLPAGKLGDKLGYRTVLVAGLAVFGVASLLASRTTTASELIVMRTIMGAGAAVIMPMGLAAIPLMFPGDADRRRAVSVTTICAIGSLPLGPLLGGWMLTHFAWGWIFLINVPVTALALAGAWLLLPDGRDPANPRLDWPGTLLSAAGITAVVYAIIEEPGNGWRPAILASLLGGLALIAAFAAWQFRAAEPLIDVRLFRDRLFTWGTVSFAIISFAMTGVLFILTPYLQSVLGNNAQGTGLRLLPMIGALIAGAAPSEKAAARFGVKFVIPAGMILSATGLVFLTHVVPLALIIFGLGLGLSLPLAADAVLGTLAAHQQGMGNALSRTLQGIGVALGTAILGSVLNTAYRGGLSGHAATSIAAAHQSAARLPGPAGHALIRAADTAYVHGMTMAGTVCIVVLLVGAAFSLWLLPAISGSET